MPEKIISFGYKNGMPTTPHTEVIDIRPLFGRNPHRDKTLRHLTGLDPRVAADVRLTPDYATNFESLRVRVASSRAKVVALGCTGGHHRSVHLAEQIGFELDLRVEHRDLLRE